MMRRISSFGISSWRVVFPFDNVLKGCFTNSNMYLVSLRTDHMGLRVRKDGSRKRDKNDKSESDR